MAQNDLIEKWLRGDLSPEEQAAFDALEEASFYRKIVATAGAFKASEFTSTPNFEAFNKRLAARQATTLGRRAWLRPMLRIASMLVVGLLVSYFFIYNRSTHIETGAGEKREVVLPDASRVLVNAGSDLRYKKARWESDRRVTLEGEAYFKVAKGARFDVVTPSGTVSVLGTQFNVRHRGGNLEVYCYEGLVRVETPNNRLELPAGHYFQLSQGQVANGSHGANGPSWAQGMSRFERAPFSEVVAELERQFGVTIALNGVDATRLFTGSFLHGDLDQALEAVTRPLKLEYQITTDQRITLKPIAQ